MCIISLYSLNSNAQSAKKNYTQESIYLKTNLLGSHYIKNGKTFRISLFDTNLQNEMKVSVDAVKEYNKYKFNRNTGLILSVVGVSAMLGSVFYIASKKDAKYSENERTITGSIYLTGLIMSFSSLYFTIKSSNNLQKSIWLRNRDILEF